MEASTNSVDLEIWRSFARSFFDVVANNTRADIRAHVSSTKRGRLITSDLGFDGALFGHHPRTHNAFDNPYLLVECYRTGENRGRLGAVLYRTFTAPGGEVDLMGIRHPTKMPGE